MALTLMAEGENRTLEGGKNGRQPGKNGLPHALRRKGRWVLRE